MAGTVVLVGLASSHAIAQPDEFEACKARRRTLMTDAMKVSDPDDRAVRLRAMPICRREELDDRTEIVEPPAPDAPDTSPYANLVVAVRAGVSATFVMSDDQLAPRGAGPFVEVEGGYRWSRGWSITGVASYARFGDDRVAVSNGVYVSATIITVTEAVTNLGVRAAHHVGPFAYGLGVGLGHESWVGYQGMEATNLLRSEQAFVTYQLGRSHTIAGELSIILDDAGTFDGGRELVSGRLAVGVRL